MLSVPGTAAAAGIACLINKWYYRTGVTEEAVSAQKGEVICPKSHSLGNREARI